MNVPNFDFPEGHVMRRGRLMTSGIIFGLMGVLCCLTPLSSVLQMTMFGLTSSALPPDEAAEIEAMQKMVRTSAIINIIVYGLFTVVLLSIAYASIFLKRWARPLGLICAWLLLYFGIVAMVTVFLMRPIMEDAMNFEAATLESPTIVATTGPASPPPGATTPSTPSSPSAQPGTTPGASPSLPPPPTPPPASPPVLTTPSPGPPPGMDNFIFIFMAVMLTMAFVFGVLLPILLIWLNWSRDVKVTLEFCDPKERWTDRCPIPVLGISVVAAVGAITSLASFLLPWAPFFGRVLTGNEARIFFAVVVLLLIFIAVASYKKHLAGWLAAILLIVGGTVSAWMTFPSMNLTDLYLQMGMPREMVEEMMGEGSPLGGLFANDSPLRFAMLVGFLPFAIYLGWALRFFRPGKADAPTETTPPSPSAGA